MSREDLALWVEVLTPAFLVLVALWRWERRLTRRLDSIDGRADHLTAELARQFGGNGGGIREAVNDLKDGQRVITERLDKHLQAHADSHR